MADVADLEHIVREIHAEVTPFRAGDKAVYIPQLAKINDDVRPGLPP